MDLVIWVHICSSFVPGKVRSEGSTTITGGGPMQLFTRSQPVLNTQLPRTGVHVAFLSKRRPKESKSVCIRIEF